ncbi:MAG: hypothetical protein AAGD10_15480 [Myxococcota bacterium]
MLRIALLASFACGLSACGGTGDACEEPGTTNGCPDDFGCQIATLPGPDEITQTDAGGNIIAVQQCFRPELAQLSVCQPICETTADCDEGEICDLGFLSELRTCRVASRPSLPSEVICEEFR